MNYKNYTKEYLNQKIELLQNEVKIIKKELEYRKSINKIIVGSETYNISTQVSSDKTLMLSRRSTAELQYDFACFRDGDTTSVEIYCKEYNILVEGRCTKCRGDEDNQYVAFMLAKHKALARFNEAMVDYIIKDVYENDTL